MYYINNSKGLDILEINYTINGEKEIEGQSVSILQALQMHVDPMVKKDCLQLLGRHFLLMPNDDVISNLNYVVSWKKVPSKLKTFEKLLSKYLPMVDVKSSIEKNIYNGDYIDFN